MKPTRTLCLALACALLSGCLEREEQITVDADGGVTIVATWRTGDRGDLVKGDPVPTVAGGWLVEESVDTNEDGEQTHRLRAEAAFPLGHALPASFATPGDVNADVALEFPTTLSVDARRDGTYYDFRRVYTPREWAPLGRLKKQMVDDRLEKLEGRDPATLTHEERKMVLNAFVDFEIAKLVIFARRAWLDVVPDAPQECWLAVLDSLERVRDELDFDHVARLLGADEEVRDEALSAEAQRWEEAIRQRMDTSVHAACGLGGGQVQSVRRRYDEYRRAFDVTEDLGDDKFTVTVEMPGVIIGSNADEVNGTRATWTFDGNRLRDADLELLVSSRVDAN